MRKLIYVASPYSHHLESIRHERYMAAVEHCASLTRNGSFAFSPIVHWHVPALYYDLPKDFDYWKDYNLHMLSFCSRLDVLQLVGWKESTGVQAEIAFAQEHDIPIVYTLI